MKWLENIIDHALAEMSSVPIRMMTPARVPEGMQDPSIETIDDWKGWKPMDSIILDADIDRFEFKIGQQLPASYRHFLKYKHFFQLRLRDTALNFPPHLPDHELSALHRNVFDMLEPEMLIGRNYIYFADFHDYGLLCFDANESREDNEYPIVYIDLEDTDSIHLYAHHFRELMESESEKGNRFIDYLNNEETS